MIEREGHANYAASLRPNVADGGSSTPVARARSASRHLGPFVVVILLGLILTYQLLIPPVIGMADQGDFSRIFNRFGIKSDISDRNRRYLRYFIRTWTIQRGAGAPTGFLSPDIVLMAISLRINQFLFKSDTFDMRSLALVRMTLFLFAALLILRLGWRQGQLLRVVVAFGLLVVFADVGYVAYFNSAYSEPSSFLFALLAVAFYLRLLASEGTRSANLIAFLVSSVMLIWSKPQNILVCIPLALITLRLAIVGNSRRWKAATTGGALVLLAMFPLFEALPPPSWYKDAIRYIAVFKVLLPSSPNPRADLVELGVDPELVSLSNTYPWTPGLPILPQQLKAGFYDRMTDGKIVRFYLQHPGRLWPLLSLAAPRSLWLQPSSLGNFEETTGLPPSTLATSFSFRSTFFRRFGPSQFSSILAWLAVAVAVATFSWLRARTVALRLASEGVAVLVVGALIQYCMVGVLQGHQSVEKGMFLFAFFFDATFVATLALGAAHCEVVLKRWRGSCGVVVTGTPLGSRDGS